MKKNSDVKFCRECGVLVDAEEPECPECGGGLEAAYLCDVCEDILPRSEYKWHRAQHFEGLYYGEVAENILA